MSKEIDAYVNTHCTYDLHTYCFRFVYLSSNEPIAFENWGTSTEYGAMPNNLGSGQHCVHFFKLQSHSDHWVGPPGSWNDVECSFTRYFICEKVE